MALQASAAGAWAQAPAPLSGLYIAGGAGPNFRANSDLALRDGAAAQAQALGLPTTAQLGFTQPGPVVLGSLGWGFGNGLRLETEFSYRASELRSLSASGFGTQATLTGTTNTYATMANLIYEFPGLGWRLGGPVAPYLGAGAGYAWSAYRRAALQDGHNMVVAFGVDGRFAGQAIAGLAWDLGRLVRGLTLTTEYRFFGVLEQTVKLGVHMGHATLRDAPVGATNANHAILIGLRYAFGPSAP
jgi:opacity protein-like surface antigen